MGEIHLIPWGGLGNRFRAINGAIELLKILPGSTLIVRWYPHKELNANVFDLIENVANVHFENNEIKDWIFKHIIKWKWLEKFNQIYRLIFKLFYDEVIFDYELKSNSSKIHWQDFQAKKVLIISCREIFKFNDFRNFTFKQEVIDTSLLIPENTIGVHVRRGDHHEIIHGSPLDHYLNYLHQEGNNFDKIFLATDDQAVKDLFKVQFKDKLIIQDKPLSRNSFTGIVSAINDLIGLSKCKTVLGNSKSSFIDFANRFGITKEFIDISD